MSYSFAFSFKVGALNRINRLLKFSEHTIWLDEQNILKYQNLATNFKVTKANQFYTLVFTVDNTHRLVMYVGEKDKTLARCLNQSQITGYLNFNSAIAMSNFIFGYGIKPSTGYLQSGQFANIRFWTRALTEEECQVVDTKQNEMLEKVPLGCPSGVKYTFFPLGGNTHGTDGYYISPHNTSYDVSALEWTACGDRFRRPSRALKSTDGSFTFKNIASLFTSGYILNGGNELTKSNYGRRGSYNISTSSIPNWKYYYLAENVSEVGNADVSINYWIKLDAYPSKDKECVLYERIVDGTGAGPKFVTKIPSPGSAEKIVEYDANVIKEIENNYYLAFVINAEGQILVKQQAAILNKNETPWMTAKTMSTNRITSTTIPLDEWVMLTLTCKKGSSFVIYVNGREIGNVPTAMKLGYLPPLDTRVIFEESSGIKGGVFHIPTSLRLYGVAGSIDEITVYDNVLAYEDVCNIYNFGLPASDYYHAYNFPN